MAGKIERYKDGQGEEGIRIGGSANAYIYMYIYGYTCVHTYIKFKMSFLQILYNWILLLEQL